MLSQLHNVFQTNPSLQADVCSSEREGGSYGSMVSNRVSEIKKTSSVLSSLRRYKLKSKYYLFDRASNEMSRNFQCFPC